VKEHGLLRQDDERIIVNTDNDDRRNADNSEQDGEKGDENSHDRLLWAGTVFVPGLNAPKYRRLVCFAAHPEG
jgi:hypothetical protein